MWKTGDPEMATPKRVRTRRPKHSDISLSREWRINMANKKKAKTIRVTYERSNRLVVNNSIAAAISISLIYKSSPSRQ